MNTTTQQVHLVIPCLRESGRITTFLSELCIKMSEIQGVQIQVVDDGSEAMEQQQMHKIVESFRTAHPHLLPLLCLPENIGKGGAVYAGWAACHQNATLLAFVDADGSCSAGETARIIQQARETATQALFASRIKMLGYSIQRLLKRHLLGRVYATLVSEALNIPVYDSQCGLKIIPRSAYEKIAPSLQIKGFAFDVELLVRLSDSGCIVKEFPINWHETANGKVRLIRDSWLMLKDVIKIRNSR